MKEVDKSKRTGDEQGEVLCRTGISEGGLSLISDLSVVVIGFLLASRHFAFSSYPFGVAFVASLPKRVWLGLLGAAIGSLTLGKSGIIYSMICVLVVFLRVVISGAPRGGDGGERHFCEGITLRLAAAVIGGFVIGIYEILISGFGLASVSFSLAMILLPAAIVPPLSVAFGSGVGLREFLIGTRSFFAPSVDKRERVRMIAFRISLLIFIFIISYSLSEYSFFGVDLGLIFSSLVSLIAAKRFGAVTALSVGFVSSFSISGLYSVAFALSGAAAGALFSFGSPYAVLGAGAALSLWGLYAGGGSGMLSVLPEFAIAAAIAFPLFGYLGRERHREDDGGITRTATDMVGTMALAHKNRGEDITELIRGSIGDAAAAIRRFSSDDDRFYSAFSGIERLVSEASERARTEALMNEELTESLAGVFSECGFPGGVIRAFGERRKHVICAGEDRDGLLITSPELRSAIERAAGIRMSPGEYFRRADMVLWECDAAAKITVEGAYVQAPGDGGEISGDTVRTFETEDLYSCAVIADGMGRGERAAESSEFVTSFIESLLGCGASVGTLLSLANEVMRRDAEECCVGLDMFLIDKIDSSARFVKSGAAPSYIKRGDSIFKISSRTVPMGLMANVDAEEIRADCRVGDYIIMLSDGIISEEGAESRLLELLHRCEGKTPSEYADGIIRAAMSERGRKDDMSVIVLRISER